jgi:hypothetical protein
MPGNPAAIEEVYVNGFRRGFDSAYQQQESLLLPYVEHVTQKSELEFFDRIGVAEDMKEDNVRLADNEDSIIEYDRRRMIFRDFKLGKYIEEKDLHRIATDPQNPITQNMTYSAKRKLDDLILEGIYASAWTGKKGETEVKFVTDGATAASGKIKVGAVSKGQSNPITTSGKFVLESGNYEGIVVDGKYDGSGTPTAGFSGITIPKLNAVRFTMLRLESISIDQVLPIWMGSAQWEQLSELDEIRNADYAVRKSLAEGLPTVWNGFHFHHSERLPVDSDGNRRCLVMANSNKMGRYAAKLSMPQSINVRMWRDTAKELAPYISVKMKAQCHRFWGEITAEVKCAD